MVDRIPTFGAAHLKREGMPLHPDDVDGELTEEQRATQLAAYKAWAESEGVALHSARHPKGTPVAEDADISPEFLEALSAAETMNLVMELIENNLRAARAIELAKLLDSAAQDTGLPRKVLFDEWCRRELIASEGHN